MGPGFAQAVRIRSESTEVETRPQMSTGWGGWRASSLRAKTRVPVKWLTSPLPTHMG